MSAHRTTWVGLTVGDYQVAEEVTRNRFILTRQSGRGSRIHLSRDALQAYAHRVAREARKGKQ